MRCWSGSKTSARLQQQAEEDVLASGIYPQIPQSLKRGQNYGKTAATGGRACPCRRYVSGNFGSPKKRVQKQYKSGTKFGRVLHGVHAKNKAVRRKKLAVVLYLQTQQHPPDMCLCGCLCMFNIRAAQLHRRSMHKSGAALVNRLSKISTLRDFGSSIRISFEERRKGVQYVRRGSLYCYFHGLSSVSVDALCQFINVLAKV